MSPENVKAAFRKTGVHPFNPSVVTKKDLAASRPHSVQSNLPVAPATPLRIIARALQDLSLEDDTPLKVISKSDEPPSPSARPSRAQ
ncbi:hypothetical protein FA15DRAFT_708065, partial [Coprinopsis marcescibilis]